MLIDSGRRQSTPDVVGNSVMSRYILDNAPDFRVIVGWDQVNQTYYLRVEDKFKNHEVVVQEGILEPLDDLEQLIEALEPFASLPDTLQQQLEADRLTPR